MSPFFHGSVRPVKRYPRPWSLNPRLNPDLDKGSSTRMSILGLPSFETGTNLPVFNGLYPKPSRPELSKIDEAVVVSLSGDSRAEPTEKQPHDDEHDVPVMHAVETTSVTEPSAESATIETDSHAVERTPLEPIIEAPTVEAPAVEAPAIEAPAIEVPADEYATETAPPEPSESSSAALTTTTENPVLPGPEPLPVEAPIVNDVVDHGILGDDSPESAKSEHHPTVEATENGARDAAAIAETAEEEQTPTNEKASNPGAVVENKYRVDDIEPQSELEEPVSSPVQAGAEVERAIKSPNIPASPLPPIREEPVASEEPEANLEHVVSEAHDQGAVSAGAAGLGSLEVIKEEAAVSDVPVTAAHEDALGSDANLHGDSAVTNEVLATSGLTPVDEYPEILEDAAASDEPAAIVGEESGTDPIAIKDEEAAPTNEILTASGLTPVDEAPEGAEGEPAVSEELVTDHSNAHDGDPASDEQAASEDVTPVDEFRGFSGVTEAVQPAADQEEESMRTEAPNPFETPFETPMERRPIATEDSTPFETSLETPAERPFWASGTATQHDAEHSLENDETTQAPFLSQHSPDQETDTGDDTLTWETSHAARRPHGVQGHGVPSDETASVAEAATDDVEPLITDEQLDVSDDFRPGAQIHSVEYTD